MNLLPASLRRALARRDAYRLCFGTPAGREVLADLARFCGEGKSGFVQGEPDSTAYNLGLRAVWIRIREAVHISDAEMQRLLDQARAGDQQGIEE